MAVRYGEEKAVRGERMVEERGSYGKGKKLVEIYLIVRGMEERGRNSEI